MIQINQARNEQAEATPLRVVVPARHDGIGAALRTSFLPRANDTPAEIMMLIEKLR